MIFVMLGISGFVLAVLMLAFQRLYEVHLGRQLLALRDELRTAAISDTSVRDSELFPWLDGRLTTVGCNLEEVSLFSTFPLALSGSVRRSVQLDREWYSCSIKHENAVFARIKNSADVIVGRHMLVRHFLITALLFVVFFVVKVAMAIYRWLFRHDGGNSSILYRILSRPSDLASARPLHLSH